MSPNQAAPPPEPNPNLVVPNQVTPPTPDPTRPNGDATPPPAPPVSGISKSYWTMWHTLSLLVLLVVFGAVCVTQPPHVGFLAGLGLLTLFVVIVGHGVVGEWLGALIDERNRMSMSRLQTALWTVVVMSGFLAAAAWNVRLPADAHPKDDDKVKNAKIGVGVPVELWLVIGISVTSLAGTPLIRSALTNKGEGDKDQSAPELKALDDRKGKKSGEGEQAAWAGAYANGRIACLRSPAYARVADLFQGEQTTDATHLDLGKVQVFFFTALLVFAYAAMLVQDFYAASGKCGPFSLLALPTLDKGMVAVLGISHAGYLANKGVDRGPVK